MKLDDWGVWKEIEWSLTHIDPITKLIKLIKLNTVLKVHLLNGLNLTTSFEST